MEYLKQLRIKQSVKQRGRGEGSTKIIIVLSVVLSEPDLPIARAPEQCNPRDVDLDMVIPVSSSFSFTPLKLLIDLLLPLLFSLELLLSVCLSVCMSVCLSLSLSLALALSFSLSHPRRSRQSSL